MSTSWKPSSSGEMKKVEGSRSKTVIGVSQSDTETVDDYKSKFLEAAKNVGVEEETLLTKWFRDGLREDIKREVRRTMLKDTMEKIIKLACEVETRRLNETRVPEESKDKEMILCEDEKPEDDEEEDELEDDVEEDPDEDIGDYHRDMRYWDYDDLDDWGVGTPPH